MTNVDELLCFLIHSTEGAFNRLHEAKLVELGLDYAQYQTILLLSVRGSLGIGELAEEFRVDETEVAATVDRLAESGLVASEGVSGDRQVVLTEAGKSMRAEIADIVGCVREALPMSDEEISEVADRLKSLRQHLDKAAAGLAPRV